MQSHKKSQLSLIWEEWFSATTATAAHDHDDTNSHHRHYKYNNDLPQKPSIWSLNRFHRYWKRMCRPENVYSYWMKRMVVQEVVKEVAMMASEVGIGRRRRPVSLEDRVGKALEIVQREIDEAGSITFYYKYCGTRRGSTT
ncbi:hypothetical protein BGZ95_010878 [Linnemannia exigua]|uniref:Uncharacterized protein n=1 Tax=Linnemannia exigua TaxID=604196 RepID=A0AAD4DAP9_9FUNG|nr:hypothetical protein BGZ95_010878 [Linnemannia exigua]